MTNTTSRERIRAAIDTELAGLEPAVIFEGTRDLLAARIDVALFGPAPGYAGLPGPLTAAVVSAAREMLLFGQHDGECERDEDGRCVLHMTALAARSSALTRALAALDEVAGRP